MVSTDTTYMYEDHPEVLLPHYRERQAFVYRCKDARGTIIYVGHTTHHPSIRIASHRREQADRIAGRRGGIPWFHLAASVDWVEMPTRKEAIDEERRQIYEHSPLGNVVGNI